MADLVLGNAILLQSDEYEIVTCTYAFVVIVTQDCDLEQDCRARNQVPQKAGGMLRDVLLVVGGNFEEEKAKFGGADIAKQVKQNKHDRYQFLGPASTQGDLENQGFPALFLDFRRLFSAPMEALERAVKEKKARRRGYLKTPYAEHLAVRLGYFLQRVALPIDHGNIVVSPPQAVEAAASLPELLPPQKR